MNKLNLELHIFEIMQWKHIQGYDYFMHICFSNIFTFINIVNCLLKAHYLQ